MCWLLCAALVGCSGVLVTAAEWARQSFRVVRRSCRQQAIRDKFGDRSTPAVTFPERRLGGADVPQSLRRVRLTLFLMGATNDAAGHQTDTRHHDGTSDGGTAPHETRPRGRSPRRPRRRQGPGAPSPVCQTHRPERACHPTRNSARAAAPQLRPGTLSNERWLADRSFPSSPQHIALQEYRDTIDEAERRLARLSDQLRQLVPTWRWAPVVDALQALRGVSFVRRWGSWRNWAISAVSNIRAT
jgi:hypothetical protein